MNSCFFNARLRHKRFYPASHEFEYHVPVFVFDLAELESGAVDGPLFGRRTLPGSPSRTGSFLPRLISFRENDYLYLGPGGLRRKLGYALTAGGLDPELSSGPIRLITSARFLGSVFNPVSFWLILAQDPSESLAAVVAEVNNTFGEKHLYVLGGDTSLDFPARFKMPKVFHVSPFNDLQGEYVFCFADPRQGLDLSVELIKNDRSLLLARLWSEEAGQNIRAGSMIRFLIHPQRMLTYPRILKEAAKLYYRKKLPVHSKPPPSHPMTIRSARTARPGLFSRVLQKLLTTVLRQVKTGRISLVQPSGSRETYHGLEQGPEVELVIKDQRFFKALAFSGDIGFGEAYSAGWWTTPDLFELLRFFVLNQESLSLSTALKIPGPTVSFFNLLRRLGGRRNTRPGARENILAHYDLGDELFKTFLDPSMAYSCAFFEHEDMSLAEAQEAKYRRIAAKLDLKPNQRVLEIGCGWGGFALYLAEHFGCRVHGITVSDNQLAFARQKAEALNLTHLVSFELLDYRDIRQTYDRIVSIEMLEAVGHAFHKTFFAALDRLLAPEGQIVLQFIAIHDQRYQAYRFEGDWTRKHIFPGGLLPSLTRVMEVIRDKTGFTLRSLDSLADHYVKTLAAWRENFLQNKSHLETLGYDPFFQRTWDYYFAYCMAGFSCRVIDDYQIVLARPAGRQPAREL